MYVYARKRDNGERISFLHVFLFSLDEKLFPPCALLYIIGRLHLRVEMSFRNNDKGKGYIVFLDYLLYLGRRSRSLRIIS